VPCCSGNRFLLELSPLLGLLNGPRGSAVIVFARRRVVQYRLPSFSPTHVENSLGDKLLTAVHSKPFPLDPHITLAHKTPRNLRRMWSDLNRIDRAVIDWCVVRSVLQVESTNVLIDGCLFDSCYASKKGGGFHQEDGYVSVINSLFYNNVAGSTNEEAGETR